MRRFSTAVDAMHPKTNTERLNRDWAKALVDACLQRGVDHFFIAPGSRCTPLTIAIATSPDAKVVQHLDERGLAFAAVGYGRASGRPAAVVCTSGTAVANLLPAVIESSMDHVPLLLLTADRPPELREAGANQTIDQQRIFGPYVQWFFDLPCPTDDVDVRFVRATLDHALDQSEAGPVHLNCMYREPFGDWDDCGTFLKIAKRRRLKSQTRYELSLHGGNTLVAVGGCRRDEALAARLLADQLKCPLLADVTSGLRGLSHDLQLLRDDNPHPDTVIHVGGRIISKRWLQFLDKNPPAQFVHLHSHPSRVDPLHRVTQRVIGGIPELCHGIHVDRMTDPSFTGKWTSNSEIARQTADEILHDQRAITEPAVAQIVANSLPLEQNLFLGNSLPIRDMDAFGRWSSNRHVHVGANRGASGIDGLVASAYGFAIGRNATTTAIIGDLSLLHDINALNMLAHARVPVIMIVVNNDGGGIFHFLPVATPSLAFEQFFGTPHGLGFRRAAEMFQLQYAKPESPKSFEASYREALAAGQSALIEVRTNRHDNLTLHRTIERQVRERSV